MEVTRIFALSIMILIASYANVYLGKSNESEPSCELPNRRYKKFLINKSSVNKPDLFFRFSCLLNLWTCEETIGVGVVAAFLSPEKNPLTAIHRLAPAFL